MESKPVDMVKIDMPKADSDSGYINTGDGIKNIKYPFNGQATNLIDKFLVFAYDQKTKEYTLNNFVDKKFRDIVQTRYYICNFQERPNIVNEICNDYHKDLLDNKLISELIFPNIPKMYYLPKNDINLRKECNDDLLTQTYQIIFSINPQGDGSSKKSYNGLGYVFYLIQEDKDPKNGEIKGYMFYPVAYCILSEYPYFQKFTEICRNVKKKLGTESDEIPIDIILYNTVKYMPSPIKRDINLIFGAPFSSSFNPSFKENNNKKNDNNLNLKNSNSINNVGIPTITFPQLSGYPLMDINMSFIFSLIPPDIIIEVFIFTFLEHDIIFYSTRPEVLNMVMFIFSNLNYPFNDSIYYWHILSVSLQSFMTGSSDFVGKTCSSLVGILNEYKPEVLTTQKIREHFVLDIDNKTFFYLYSEETEDVKKTMILHNYIKSCALSLDDNNLLEKQNNKTKINEKQFDDGVGLYKAIVDLQEELYRRCKKVTNTDYNGKTNKPSFMHLYEDEKEYDCIEANFRLQKAFLIFITQILVKYVQILEVNSDQDIEDRSSSISNFKINIKKDESLSDEEMQRKKLAIQAGQIFKSKFKETQKYSNFVVNFIQFHDTIDVYKIPYTFISEFIYYSHVTEKNNLSEVDVFRLIDKFYGKSKRLTLDEEIKNFQDEKKSKNKDKKKSKDENNIIIQNENAIYFKFDTFANYYLNNLKNYITREQEDDKDCFFKVKKPTKNKCFGRKGHVLSNKILIKYVNYLNNLEDPLKEFKFLEFPKDFDNSNDKKDENYNLSLNSFDHYELVEISEVVERHFIMERCFTSYGLIKFSLLNVLAITRSFYKGNYIKSREDIKKMCRFCKQTKSLVRKYMFIYLNIFNALKKYHYLEDNICDECTKVIANYFNEVNMIPTEAISRTLFDIVKKPTNSSIEFNDSNNSITTDPFGVNTLKASGVTKNDYFNRINKKSKVFPECLSVIEAVFDGNFKNFTFVEDQKDLKFFEENYSYIKNSLIKKLPEGKDKKEREKEINKKKFDLKTPLILYRDTYNALNSYLQKYNIDDINFEDLYCNLLCLIYYFKIPIIENKWIERYLLSDKEKEKISDKITETKDKKKDNLKENTKKVNKENELIKKTIPDIIEMLTELFWEVKNYLIKQNKIYKK